MTDLLSSWLFPILAIAMALMFFKSGSLLVAAVQGTSSKGKKKFGKWTTFVVYVIGGLLLGAGLYRIVRWLTGLGGIGEFVGSVGAIAAVWLGWHAFQLTTGAVKDIAKDREPDADARQAAKWVPTMLPPGFAAVYGIITEPRSLGVSITAAIMAVITVVYCRKISFKGLEDTEHPKQWKWFAAGMHTLAGLVMISLALYADALIARYLPAPLPLIARVLAGAGGMALLAAAFCDVFLAKDGFTPDKYVRAFCMYGIPLLFVGGVAAWGYLQTGTGTGLEYLRGSFA